MKTPRETAHEAVHCEGVDKGGAHSAHDGYCDDTTEAIEARDAEHAARLATLVGGLRETLRPYATGCAFAVRAYLARLDAESSGPAIPDGTVK